MECMTSGFSPQNPVYQQNIHAAWKDFIDGNEIRGRIPDAILEGWLLSREARIDPLHTPEVPVLERQPFADLCDRYAGLLKAAEPVLEMLDSYVSSIGHIAILTASSGHILATVGDKALLDVARVLYNMPGADRNIGRVGASAIGIALRRNTSVQICGFEHYNAALHSWRCSSAPILADASGVLAVLTLSGNVASPEIQALALANTFADCISMRIRQQNMEASGYRLEALLRDAHDSLSHPLLVLDAEGIITHANAHASGLFTAGSLELPGRKAASLVSGADAQRFWRAVSSREKREDILTFITDSGPRRIACVFTPVGITRSGLAGVTLTLMPSAPAGAAAGAGAAATAPSGGRSAPGSRKAAPARAATAHRARYQFTDIRGSSPALQRAIDFAKRASNRASRIVIHGESGTGKELFAQAIHNAGSATDRPFVGISCAAIPDTLIEAELFGYEEGAFTGARKGGKKGRLELANGGTLFLDEVNSLSLEVQAKLLRVLQEMVLFPLGGDRVVRLDVRVIAAGNVNLAEAVRAGTFRSDLYYRLNVVEIGVPALREREGDVELLARLFWRRLHVAAGISEITVEPAAIEALAAYSWPGNVRELQNVCEHAWVLSDGAFIRRSCLPQRVLCREAPDVDVVRPNVNRAGQSMDDLYEDLVRKTLGDSGGNISKAAEKLGIARTTLYRKMRKYGLL